MTQLSLQIPQVNQPDATEDPKIASNFTAIQNVINGNLDTSNLASGTVDGRGFVNIPTSESRTNVAYGTLATPDQVTGIVLPANGLIAVWYQATISSSVSGAASAVIALGGNSVRIFDGTSSTVVLQAPVLSGTGPGLLFTSAVGLAINTAGTYPGDVSTGQIIGEAGLARGGPCYIFAAAGTYTVSVRFKASVGSVTVSNRQLWVRALSF